MMTDQQRMKIGQLLGAQQGINPMLMQEVMKRNMANRQQGMPPGAAPRVPGTGGLRTAPPAQPGMPMQPGMPPPSTTSQGMSPQGMPLEGPTPPGTPLEGPPPPSMPPELAQMPAAGMPPSTTSQGMPSEGGGLAQLAGQAAPLQLSQQQLPPDVLQKLAMKMRG